MKKALFFGAQSLKSFLRQKLPKFVASIPLIWLTNISQSPIGNLILRPSLKTLPWLSGLDWCFHDGTVSRHSWTKTYGHFSFFFGGHIFESYSFFLTWRPLLPPYFDHAGHWDNKPSNTEQITIFFVFHPKKWWFCKQQTLFSEAKPPSVNGLFGSCPVSGLTMDCFMGVVT